MALKRKSESCEIPAQEPKRRNDDDTTQKHTIFTGTDNMEVIYSMCGGAVNFESTVRRVIRETLLDETFIQDLVLAMARCHYHNPSLMGHHFVGETSKSNAMELRFISKLKEEYYTDTNVLSKDEKDIEIGLFSAGSGTIVRGRGTMEVEIYAMDGDFGSNGNCNWSKDEFNASMLRPRDGKKAVLKRKICITLEGGVGSIPGEQLQFTDNSCWTRSRKFTLAARSNELLLQAATEPFRVKDKRGLKFSGNARKQRPLVEVPKPGAYGNQEFLSPMDLDGLGNAPLAPDHPPFAQHDAHLSSIQASMELDNVLQIDPYSQLVSPIQGEYDDWQLDDLLNPADHIIDYPNVPMSSDVRSRRKGKTVWIKIWAVLKWSISCRPSVAYKSNIPN